MAEPLDLTTIADAAPASDELLRRILETWQEYRAEIPSEAPVGFGQNVAQLNRVAWMGERMGHVLAEVGRLRALLDDIPEHVIQVRAATFTLKHPLSCRPNLFACPFNDAGRDLDGPPAPLGCYVVTLDDAGNLIIGEAVNG